MRDPMTKSEFIEIGNLYSKLVRGDHEPDYMICDGPTFEFVNHAFTCPILKRMGRFVKCAHGWRNYYGVERLKLDPKRLPQ